MPLHAHGTGWLKNASRAIRISGAAVPTKAQGRPLRIPAPPTYFSSHAPTALRPTSGPHTFGGVFAPPQGCRLRCSVVNLLLGSAAPSAARLTSLRSYPSCVLFQKEARRVFRQRKPLAFLRYCGTLRSRDAFSSSAKTWVRRLGYRPRHSSHLGRYSRVPRALC